jgi:hypothetical protein
MNFQVRNSINLQIPLNLSLQRGTCVTFYRAAATSAIQSASFEKEEATNPSINFPPFEKGGRGDFHTSSLDIVYSLFDIRFLSPRMIRAYPFPPPLR